LQNNFNSNYRAIGVKQANSIILNNTVKGGKIGFDVYEAQNRITRIVNNDIEIDQTRIIAQTGWTTADLINAIEGADVSDLKNEKLISLLIGVNNQFQNLDFDSFKEEFDQLLDISIGFGGEANRVFVVSIPDYGVTPFGSNNAEQIGQELDNYNAYMSNKCASRNIPFIDITQISRDLSDAPNSLALDNLHPSGFQYGKWADKILPVALELFSK
jgi:lysophospholipase L1-like esterase